MDDEDEHVISARPRPLTSRSGVAFAPLPPASGPARRSNSALVPKLAPSWLQTQATVMVRSLRQRQSCSRQQSSSFLGSWPAWVGRGGRGTGNDEITLRNETEQGERKGRCSKEQHCFFFLISTNFSQFWLVRFHEGRLHRLILLLQLFAVDVGDRFDRVSLLTQLRFLLEMSDNDLRQFEIPLGSPWILPSMEELPCLFQHAHVRIPSYALECCIVAWLLAQRRNGPRIAAGVNPVDRPSSLPRSFEPCAEPMRLPKRTMFHHHLQLPKTDAVWIWSLYEIILHFAPRIHTNLLHQT